MSVQKIPRKPRLNERPDRKHYDYKVRWRTRLGKQPSVVVADETDAHDLDRRMKLVPAETAAEARAWLLNRTGDPGGIYPISAARGQGITPPQHSPTLTEAIDGWLERPLAPSSVEAYRGSQKLCEPIGHIPIHELTKGDVLRLLAHLSDTNAPLTQKQVLVVIKGALGYYGIDTDDIHAATKKLNRAERQIEPYYLSPEQAQALLRTAKAAGPHVYGPVRFSLDVGFRWGETMGLTSRYVRLDGPRPGVVAKWQIYNKAAYRDGLKLVELKTPKSKRRVPISAELAKVLEDYVSPAYPDLPIFHPPRHQWWTHSAWNREWLKLRASVPGLPGDVRFHDLRHSFVSRARHHGVDLATVSKVLGHSSLAVTFNTYTNWDEETDALVLGAALHEADSA